MHTASSCGRELNIAVVNFQLPDVAPEDVNAVHLLIGVKDASPQPFEVVLYGLGRQADTQYQMLISQLATDFYAGLNDPVPGATLLARSVLEAFPPGSSSPAVVEIQSRALHDHVLAELRAGGRGKYISFRLSSSTYLGCDINCDAQCLSRRVRLEPNAATLRVITVHSSPSEALPFPATSPAASPATSPGPTAPSSNPGNAAELINLTACLTRFDARYVYTTNEFVPKVRSTCAKVSSVPAKHL